MDTLYFSSKNIDIQCVLWLYTVRSTYYTIHMAQFTVHVIHSSQYTYTVHRIHYTGHNKNDTGKYIGHCTQCSIISTMDTIHRTKITQYTVQHSPLSDLLIVQCTCTYVDCTIVHVKRFLRSQRLMQYAVYVLNAPFGFRSVFKNWHLFR
jgi:hypothetical protein